MVFSQKKASGMKIVIDGRLWFESGIGRYLRNLVTNLQALDGNNEYKILLLKKDLDKVDIGQNFQKVEADFHWYSVAEQYRLPKLLNSLQPDLVHFPHFNVPIFYKGKYIVTIHDLIHQHFPTREATTRNPLVYKIKKFGYKRVFGVAVKRSSVIITPSDFVKKQLIKEWGVDDKKITITPEGVDDGILGLAKNVTDKQAEEVLNKFNITGHYIFYIGNAQPHKNIFSLIDAFRLIKQTHPNFILVLSGPQNYFWQRIKEKAKDDGIVFTGFVSDKEMVVLYKKAWCFLMPSLEEGFGIPVLEAMACGCPVVSSDRGSLSEVGGDAAVYFDPDNIEDMVEKISRVLDGKELRRGLINKGLKRYKSFSWQKMAEQTLKVYKQSLS